MWVVKATAQPLYPQERPDTHCIGGWVGTTAGLDGCGKSRPHRDSIPGPSRVKHLVVSDDKQCLFIEQQNVMSVNIKC